MSSLRRQCLFVVFTILILFTSKLICFAEVKKPEKRNTIGAIVPTLNAEFWNRYVTFMKKGAAELDVQIIMINADNKVDSMHSHFKLLLDKKVDGLIYVPYWNSGRMGLKLAAEANVPVILTDVYIPDLRPQDDFANYLAFVGPADADAGYQMALALFRATEAAENGKKHIGVVNGTEGTTVAIDRRAGLDKALREHPEIVVVGEVNGNFVRHTSQQVMEELYQTHPEIKGVWCANGGTATGVMAALKNAGKKPGKDIMVVGMDLNPENIQAIRKGELLFDIGGHWLQGGFALVMMHDYLKGFSIPKDQSNVKLGLLPVNAQLLPKFIKEFPRGMPVYDFKNHSRVYNPSAQTAVFELKYGN